MVNKFANNPLAGLQPDRPSELPDSLAWEVLDAISPRIAVLDRSLRIVALNRQWREATPKGEIFCAGGIGDDYPQACLARVEQRGADLEAWKSFSAGLAAVRDRRQSQHQCEYCHSNEENRYWRSVHVWPLGDSESGRVTVFQRDISLQKLQEAMNRASEERFDLAMRGSRHGIWDWNIATGESYYSPQLLEILGVARSEFPNVFASLQAALHPDHVERTMRALEEHLTRRVPYDVEHQLMTERGEYCWFRSRGQAMWDDQGRPIRMAGTLACVADRKRAEEALRESIRETAEARSLLEQQTIRLQARNKEVEEARRHAENANRAKSEFLANMSHEIRTPMTAILGFADLLLGDDANQSAAERRSALETIRRNGEHLLEILNDILDISKIEAGKLVVEKIRCSPARIVAEVVSLMNVRARGKGVTLDAEYATSIPETIVTDPTRLRQILLNLTGNSLKFTETGGVRLLVRFVPAETSVTPSSGSQLQFDVIDTGIGMSDEQVARLFRPFSQADSSTTRRFGGTGLGLTISKRLAGMLGGDVEVVHTSSFGSTFRVTISSGRTDSTRMLDELALAIKSSPEREVVTPEIGLSCRVLLAEDGPDNQRLISFVLRKAGAEVAVVDNGKLAMEQALAAENEVNPFDVILMDMQMPVLDGYQATRQLRAAGYRRPIIALTAHAMSGDREKCMAAGCDDYATKPIDRAHLVDILRKYLLLGRSQTASDKA